MKDKLWYFVTGRTQGAVRTVTNMYYNLNAGKADAWMYVPDLNRQAFHDRTWENASARHNKLRTASFAFLFILIVGSLFAFYLLFSRMNEQRANQRPTPAPSVSEP